MAADKDETRAPRYFFALRPDAGAAAALALLATRLAAQGAGRPLTAADIHLTLAFVGACDPAEARRLPDLLDGLLPPAPAHPGPEAEASALPARFALSRIGAFGPRLLWIGPAEPISWVQALSDELRRRLTAAGIAHDERPLRAHLTLLRGAREALALRGAATPIVPTGWTPCLGWSAPASTPQHRYDWHCHHAVKLAS
ncbi:MAG: 2'-5' RNA ligase family protein [Burkholderiaceae bacterium]